MKLYPVSLNAHEAGLLLGLVLRASGEAKSSGADAAVVLVPLLEKLTELGQTMHRDFLSEERRP